MSLDVYKGDILLNSFRRLALTEVFWRAIPLAVFSLLISAMAHAQDEHEGHGHEPEFEVREENSTAVSTDIEELKQAALELNRDLLILEEDLLFPANTQIGVYISVDVGHYFTMDAVKLKVDDEIVASHLYTEKENSALNRGGIQRLYLGNLKTGAHDITAFFYGYGPDNSEFKRAATYSLKKDQNPTMLEIRVRDSVKSLQPEFDFREWNL